MSPCLEAQERAETLAAYAVSRETTEKLDRFVASLKHWQRRMNLVGPGTLDSIWSRHILDSLQLLDHAPAAPARWADLGSGAGFPGLVLGIAGGPRVQGVDLVESNGKKAAFLRQAAAEAGASATIHHGRIEEIAPRLLDIGIVTARALAPLDQLLAWSDPLLKKGAIALFPKGRDAANELTQAANQWTFDVEHLASRTDPAAAILKIRNARRRQIV